jgi:small-conductance mechanosensitive channel
MSAPHPPLDPAAAVPPATGESNAVAAAEKVRDAVVGERGPVAEVIRTLDSYSLELGTYHLSLWSGLLVLLVIVGVWFTGRYGGKLAHRVLDRMTALDATQQLLIEKLLSVAIWAIAILVGIDLLGVDLTALAVFSGAFGLAIGFGLQKTFGNLIAGIILLMDRSIKPGDVISVADASGQESFGQIRKIGIRAISVVTRDRTEYLIPNENLMINQVVNWSYSSKDVRVKAPVGVSYDTDLELAERLMLEAAKDTPRVLDFPEAKVLLTGFGESAVNLEIRFWIDDPEDGVTGVRSDVLKRVWKLFRENGISIPFPQRDLNLKNNEQFERLVAALGERKAKPGKAGK